MWGVKQAIEKMIGKKLKSVELSKNKEKVVFKFQDGHKQVFGVEGDCCSHSWIEHLETLSDLCGATLLSVNEASIDRTDDDDYNPIEYKSEEYVAREHECLNVYSTHFVTDRGEIVLEYRNSSNGYYGGYLVDHSYNE